MKQLHMKTNMGVADRIIRPAIALGLIGWYTFKKTRGISAIALLTVAAFFVATGLTGYCPDYDLADVETITRK